MPLFKVALLQLQAESTPYLNIKKGMEACRQAKEMQADLALFPELWQLGYEGDKMHADYAIDLNDHFIVSFQELAWKLKMAIAVTYLGKGKSKPTNSLALINHEGQIIFNYAKVHTCSFDSPENNLDSGTSFHVAPLHFANGTVNIGAMICFDREFPESARTLMLQGAEIIITPNSCFMKQDPLIGDIRFQQLRARAFENMLGIALANYPKPKNDGHSCAIDVDGQPLALAQEKEEICFASFDLNRIRKWQQDEVWGAKHRHPQSYSF